MVLGYKIQGNGPEKVIVTHDWFSDCTSYDGCLPYLDLNKYTYIFADIRGYGLSKNLSGSFNLDEIVSDILELADNLKFEKFHFIGHSMTGMVAQKLAYQYKNRVKSVIAICTVPACGMKVDQNIYNFMQEAASTNDVNAFAAADMMSGNRQSTNYVNFKVKKWRESATVEARVKYLEMFVKTDFSKEITSEYSPIMFVVGQYECEGLNKQVIENTCMKDFPKAKLIVAENAAHYPMQEAPVFLVTEIEKFIGENK